VGQSATETITLTTSASATLNSLLATTISASFGPTANPQTSTTGIGVQVLSAQVLSLAQAASAAAQNTSNNNDLQLAQTLTELETFINELQTTPTDVTALSNAQFELRNVATLLRVSADPNLTALLTPHQTLQNDANTGNVSGLLADLPAFFTNL